MIGRLCDGSELVGPDALADLQRHALHCYPDECVGIIDTAGRYIPLANVAADPTRHGEADHTALAAAIRGGNVRAFCHSHPGGPDCPSEQDMRAQMDMDVPFVIVATNGQACAAPFAWGDQLLDEAPLIGRTFRHAVTDCYSLIRSFWWQEHGIRLPDYPRNWGWWHDQQEGEKDLYRRYFADAGFREVDRSEVRHSDVWLAAIRSEVPNHAGVYLDGGLALHHPSSGQAHDPCRLSLREPMARWVPYVTHWVRRT
jgi:proteasome lid subunit RPN8/RPN11